ncbi:sensor histidine kinase [Vallitalea guaymasensis]|uniref:histidine kinase n=1 Tax=Vallitalea guaymasensis TaxID=1185412 RepID=A0A8J8M985_9FIRM|nr:histidine kinase [Vallitalea guaymasensis]QUH28669.1 histidine kinase [Vallitalea guaymasensis]
MMKKKNMWKYIKSYKFQSILIKNFLLIFLIVFIPVIIITISVQSKYNNAVEDEIKTANYNAAIKTQATIDRAMQDTTRLATHLSISSVYDLFFISNKTFADYYNIIDIIYDRTREYISLDDYVHSVYLQSDSLGILYDSIDNAIKQVGLENSTLQEEDWYIKDKADNNKINRYFAWRETRDGQITGNYVSVIHYVRKKRTKILGSVTINLKVNHLAKMADMIYSENDVKTIVIDNETKKVIISKNTDDFLKNISDIDVFKSIDYSKIDKSEILSVDNEQYIITNVKSHYGNWTYLSVLPLTSYSNDVNRIYEYVKNILIAYMIISLILSYLLTMKTYEPVSTVMRIIDNPQMWDREKHRNKNEVKYISDNIFKIIISNTELEEELRNKITLLDKAQNKALQSQMNPHFLFNTLEAINWTAIELLDGYNEASDMISNLSEVLRYSLDGEQFSSVKDEVKYCKIYINIMKKRYKNKLEVKWNIQEEVYDNRIMKLTLQPIIENAIYHGIKPKRDKGLIEISCNSMNDKLEITIKDDGVGMTKEEEIELNTKINDKYLLRNQGIGMYNVNQRIKLLYGDEYGIKVISLKGIGTSIIIDLPYEK